MLVLERSCSAGLCIYHSRGERGVCFWFFTRINSEKISLGVAYANGATASRWLARSILRQPFPRTYLHYLNSLSYLRNVPDPVRRQNKELPSNNRRGRPEWTRMSLVFSGRRTFGLVG